MKTMKKIKVLLAAMLGMVAGMATADEVAVGNVTVPKGGQAVVSINLNNPDKIYTAGQMQLTLPEGVTAVLNSNGNPTAAKGERMAEDHAIGTAHLEDGTDLFTIFSQSSAAITGTEGAMFHVTVTADASLEVGTVLEGALTDIEMTTTDAVPTLFNDQTFTITIGEQADTRTVLDETSTTVPESETGVDVRVKRTINAGEWNTLCLPFAMTEAQVNEAFGDDAELADFTGWSSEEDEDGNIVNITVNFTDVTEVEANHPYIIKVSEDVSEFSIDGVDIQPEDEPTVQVGKKKAERGYFTGTYVADTEVPEDDIFLSGNKFWYSAGQTRMKAFRAYFEFADVLTDMDSSAAKIAMSFDKDKTGISRVTSNKEGNGATYNIAGQRVLKPTNGIFIKDGKKITIK